jgi:ParB family chromosome partitioning protein
MAGLSEVPVVIRELTDYEAAQISLIENLQREDLNPIEEAKAYQRLIDEFDMTQEQIAKSVGKSRAGIANSVRLLKLPDEIQKYVEEKKLSVGHAKLLCGISDEKKLLEFSQLCIDKKLTVRELETAISNAETKSKASKPKKTSDFADPFKKLSVETALSFKQLYGIDAKVSKEKGGKVSMKMTFANEQEMQDVLAKFSDKLDN